MQSSWRRYGIWLLLPLLFACSVKVDDFGGYWEKGVVDSSLPGTWEEPDQPGEGMHITQNGTHYTFTEFRKDKPAPTAADAIEMRVLYVNAHTFLMIHSTEPGEHVDNMLIRYELQGDRLVTYLPNPDMRETFLNHYRNRGILIEAVDGLTPGQGNENRSYSVRIPKLTPEVVRLLGVLAAQPQYWKVSSELKRAPRK